MKRVCLRMSDIKTAALQELIPVVLLFLFTFLLTYFMIYDIIH